ncbi:hypothetical protein O181_062836 [Austropuccinia psidii MF-1]|uniref:CAP-Gly domain-containing protein n=1 Tax=Austropuccinia psidii MF-1 TaxID=1389203 RepID=A0A9Q3HYU1_9BASI|nr:hypothetical protein [Austropuccinia psidii MF-1]
MADSNTLSVGTRVLLDGRYFGTVRFNGPVSKDDPQVWLGIEWDDQTRGKHSGRFKDGQMLFHTSVPNAGTFMKPTERLQTGRSFLKALKDKYIDQELIESSNPASSGSGLSENSLEADHHERMRAVALRLSRLDRLRHIGLDSSKVNGAGDSTEVNSLNGLLSSAETLNLSSNLLWDLNDVSMILEKLPRLKTLLLSFNRFERIPAKLPGFHHIRTLYLDSTSLTWQQAAHVATQIDGLVDLHLSRCRIEYLGTLNFISPGPFFALTALTLDENFLKDWQELTMTLKMMPRLEALSLRKNQLKVTSLLPDSVAFKSIRHLNLRSNLLQSEVELDYLQDHFPLLTHLWIMENPLCNALDENHSRRLIIAHFPTLATLESSEISASERTKAELYYFSKLKEEISTSRNEKLKDRYHELLKKFGTEQVAHSITKPHTLKAQMLKLKMIWPDEKIERQIIEVLPSMTVQSLRTYLTNIIKRSTSAEVSRSLIKNFKVHVLNQYDGTSCELDFSDGQKDLAWYGVFDGDTLKVESLLAP